VARSGSFSPDCSGTALVSVLVARYGNRLGRRTCCRLLFAGMAIAGTVFALTDALPARAGDGPSRGAR
jgi:hypothetical protein